MNLSEQIRLHVDMSDDIADAIKRLGDDPRVYAYVGIGLMHSLNALALSIDRFAAAVEPKEQP